MRYDIDVNGTRRQLSVERRDGQIVVSIGERQWRADAAQAGANTLSLLLEHVSDEASGSRIETHEVVLATDPVTGQAMLLVGGVPLSAGLTMRRRWGSKEDGTAGTGPQRIVAPMPGKVVRVLGKAGDEVAQRQSIVVIEAMKMENELRAAHAGRLTEVLVREGQSVDAGTLLALITPQ